MEQEATRQPNLSTTVVGWLEVLLTVKWRPRQRPPEYREASRKAAKDWREKAKELGLCQHCRGQKIPNQTSARHSPRSAGSHGGRTTPGDEKRGLPRTTWTAELGKMWGHAECRRRLQHYQLASQDQRKSTATPRPSVIPRKPSGSMTAGIYSAPSSKVAASCETAHPRQDQPRHSDR